MRKVYPEFLCVILFTCLLSQTSAQTPLKLSDFAIWGGSASPTNYNPNQGVTIGNSVVVLGNIGSNHRVELKNFFNISGNIYSGNGMVIGNSGKVTGDIFASKAAANYIGNVITGDYKINFTGNITGNGKIVLKDQIAPNVSTISGQVNVPEPSAVNYSGPTPAGGITNTVTLPEMPVMPNNTSFDNQRGTADVTTTTTLSPGKFRKIKLTGSKIITFNGPGNYIFEEIEMEQTTNRFIFDFKNTTTGNINIFVIKDANFGRLSVSTKNGNHPSRVYTEIHGTGILKNGNAFYIQSPSPIPAGSQVWLGNVWAPNGSIAFKSFTTSATPHVTGALWSAKKVELDPNVRLSYEAPGLGSGAGFITPYVAPPVNGKVSAASNTIGAELTVLAQNPTPITSIDDNELFIFDNNSRVLIEVISKAPNDATLRTQLIDLGMRNGAGAQGTIENGPHIYTISGYFPIAALPQLNGNTRIDFVRPLYPPISNAGLVTSQGDATMRSDAVRSRFALDGSGIKIGVISDSYNAKQGAQTDVNEGDLPGTKTNGQSSENPEPVQVVEDLTDRGSDEGRAMLQIVHDVAPKAKLAFHTGFLSAGHFARAIQTLASSSLPGGKCDVIVDDLTYITEPFQRDGVVAQAVNQAVANGVTYFSSAGNFGNKSYEAVFTGVTNTAVIPTGQIHRFGPNAADIYQTINLKPGSYTIGLQWSDEFSSLGSLTGVQTDMDLYLVDANGFQLFGFNRSNLFGDPFEICAFTVREETNAKLMIVRAAGSVNVRFKWIMFRGEGTIMNFQSTAPSTIVGHPNADSAIAVGAMLYANIPGVTPVWPGVASFSSRGGTFTKLNTNSTFTQRIKPELVGPNGVNTSVNLGGAGFNDGDTYPNFFGTSAAAPHVAAVGALIIQGRKKYNLQSVVKPIEVRRQLQSSAGKFSYLPGNFSFEGGYGYVQADSAILQIANARPIMSSLEAVEPGAENGTQSFQVRIQGKYLTTSTKIYVNNVAVTTAVSINAATGVGTAIATVPDILPGQDPLFQLFNPAKSASTQDGGLSEGLRFFTNDIKILVKAENKSRRYGQENPELTAQVSVIVGTDTTDITQTALTLADLKLDNLTLATNAVTFSSPRAYGIAISRTTPLDENDPLLTQYIFEFLPGVLTVEKMTLKITPLSKTIKYGDDLSGITYNYDLDQNGVLSPNLLEEVKSLHKQYLAENGLIVLNGFNAQNPPITAADIANMGALASFQSVVNARKFIVENGVLRPLTQNIPLSDIGNQRYIVDVATQSLQNYKTNNAQSAMVEPAAGVNARTFLNIKSLTNGGAKASTPGGELIPMVNGQLVAMVNGELQALVNGQLRALVNNVLVVVDDITFQNGQLLALVNNIWNVVPSGEIITTINNAPATVQLSVTNGQLRAIVNGLEMQLANGQLRALVNGQLVAMVNGQLRALVNGQLTPLVNGQLTAIVNGELQALTNGQLVAIVNGQLMVSVDGELEVAQDLAIFNGQLRAIVNGQLRAIVNGELKMMVDGEVTDVPTTSFVEVNGQLRAIVNEQEVAYVNGQLRALVNGQLRALVNGAGVAAESIVQAPDGELKASVNGVEIPIANGQLQAMVNGQLLAMVNGQLMAFVNGELTFVVFQNGQLRALVNGQFETFAVDPVVNGQLRAIVNGELENVTSTVIENGQLRAIVNGETWVYPNGQLKAIVNGQLRALVNNFDVSGTNNNTNTVVLVDEDDINLQFGDVGGMFAMNMITGLNVGHQTLIPAAFVNENYEVTYGLADVLITKKPVFITAEPKTKTEGDPNPPLTVNYSDFAFGENENVLCQPLVIPPTTKVIEMLERRTTYTNVVISGAHEQQAPNVYYAEPGEPLTITGDWSETHLQNVVPGYQTYCPGCISQNYIGMTNGEFTANQFDTCFDVTGLGSRTGQILNSFTAPTRPGVYYITQLSSWLFSCYQFGHMLHDQVAANAVALVIVEPVDGVSANTSATALSPAGEYPIIVGGCYFTSNYRIVYQDDILTITPGSSAAALRLEEERNKTGNARLYPNPASTVVRLSIKNSTQSINYIQIYDGTGKLIESRGTKYSEGVYEINVSGLKPGIYLIKAKTAKGIETFKFVKM